MNTPKSNLKTMKGSSSITAISECFIKPTHVVEESKKTFYLGSFELRQMSQCYLQSGLLFDKLPNKEEGGIDLFLMRLKQSLSSTLAHFYPLAGQLVTKVDKGEHNSFIFIDCNKGRGAKFIHATSSDVTVQDITSSFDTPIDELFDFGRILTNYDSHDEPILAIQVTELIDGIFIGASVNHAVVDGNSYWHFMSSWSEIFESNDTMNISRVPILERWFPQGYGPIIKIPYTNPEEFITRYDQNKNINHPLREMVFSFSHASMAALKAKANADCNVTTSSNKISSFQALSALLWRSIARSRCLKSDESITCTIVADLRSRVQPPLSQHYFGSFITGIKKSVKVGELLGNNLGWGASLLHQGFQECTNELVHKEFVEWIKAPSFPKFIESKPNLILIGGLPGANAYDIKFGLGEPVTIRAGSNKYDGRVYLEPGKQGKGSLDLHILLLPHTFSAFQKDSELLTFCSPSSM